MQNVQNVHHLDRLHATYDEQAAADYCHLWNVVGSLLGIDEALLPIERPEMDALEVTIRARTERPSDAGTELTADTVRVHMSGACGDERRR